MPVAGRNGVKCTGEDELFQLLEEQNPLLKRAVQTYNKSVARRHILIDPRTLFVCQYLPHKRRIETLVGGKMKQIDALTNFFTRLNLEVVSLLQVEGYQCPLTLCTIKLH